MSDPLVIDEAHTLPAAELSWTAVRSGGPGGQNVNKVATKVELRFDLGHTRALDLETRTRLAAIAGTRVDSEGILLVRSQKTRDQLKNLEDARAKLRELVVRALHREPPRKPTKVSRAQKRRRVEDKRKQGERKRARRADD
jgi:ribosome-associated protein